MPVSVMYGPYAERSMLTMLTLPPRRGQLHAHSLVLYTFVCGDQLDSLCSCICSQPKLSINLHGRVCTAALTACNTAAAITCLEP